MKIFVSYTTRDRNITRELLLKLYNELSEFETVYIDLIHNDSENKQKRVFDELESADQVVLIETESVYDSGWVKIELESAKILKKDIIKIPYNELIEFLKAEKSQWLTMYIENRRNSNKFKAFG
ncbi:hypothetical protein BTO04_00685 [Polaribacter sp. SA4-10]|uniref:TIR domain-containing protein n=1 Tax=Polaribacter sp. SA4-10 TaxID=754397 RepID=UPI000B3D13D6|nr:TIR domain-containing protein [Polaribacter sp. SA4-10]ARV05297.1 hypothetical protein BTO04_00685 [Polaribacter sp. SA4-10]